MDDADRWREIGRHAVADEIGEARFDVEGALYDIEMNTLRNGGDPTPEQIRDARMALNFARRVLEQYAAPAAGCESWGDPLPDIPAGRARETWHLGDGE